MVDHRLPAPATGKNSASSILCFLRISDHLVSICKVLFSPVISTGSPVAGGRPFLPLENVNTSYHTEFHQILSINVAWVPKRH